MKNACGDYGKYDDEHQYEDWGEIKRWRGWFLFWPTQHFYQERYCAKCGMARVREVSL